MFVEVGRRTRWGKEEREDRRREGREKGGMHNKAGHT